MLRRVGRKVTGFRCAFVALAMLTGCARGTATVDASAVQTSDAMMEQTKTLEGLRQDLIGVRDGATRDLQWLQDAQISHESWMAAKCHELDLLTARANEPREQFAALADALDAANSFVVDESMAIESNALEKYARGQIALFLGLRAPADWETESVDCWAQYTELYAGDIRRLLDITRQPDAQIAVIDAMLHGLGADDVPISVEASGIERTIS